ncbi:hypothetical protein CNR22_04205 [Sphingobacteriaceae bacterium]|nr:hypothetical protein CNR22_04205 [Sphingobacteriaceae bacterium]
MKKNLFLFITACFLSVTVLAQTAETEPNNMITDSGVQTLSSNGSFSGSYSFTDIEYYKLAPNTGGTISVTFTNAPAANALFLSVVQGNSVVASTSNPGTFTYVLNPALNYILYTGTGTATGAWKFTVNGLSTVSGSIVSTNVLCNAGTTGAATVIAGGGAPFTYSWLPSGGTSSVATGLSAGNYSVVITNVDGISLTKTLSITQPPALTSSNAITPPACNSSFGSATVTASGGTVPYDYLWSNSQIGSTGSFLYAGVYTVSISDANTCTTVTTVNVTEPSPIFYTFYSSGIPCHGGTGTSSVSATGGSGVYTYSWSTGATSSSVSGLPPGTHSVTVTDTYGCANLMSAIFSDPPLLVSTTTTANATCVSMGSASVNATGGTAPYTYSWSSSSTTSVVALNPGTYSVTVKDANDCISSNTLSISTPPAVSLTTTATSPSICAGETLTLTANAGGGTGAITYTWTTGSNSGTLAATPSVNTSYTVTASDSYGCAASSSVSVLVNPLPTVSVNSGVICSGSSFTIIPTGASNYSISGNTFTVTPGTTTTYSVTGTSTAGCVTSGPAIATISVNITPTISVGNSTICSGTSISITPGGATSYSISGSNFSVSPATTTSYSITGSSNGCLSSNTVVATISVNASPTIAVNDATICSGTSVVITPTGAMSYSITGNTFTVMPNTSTSYSVTGTDANGCQSNNIAVATISVNTSPTVVVSNSVICAGEQVNIVPSGADTYSITGGSFTLSPTTTTSYSITGTNLNGCLSSNTAITTVSVNATPTLSLNSPTICSGNATTLIPSGALNYTISGGNFTVSPVSTSFYTVTGTDVNGCASQPLTTTVTVNGLPIVTVASSNATICSGETATLTANGATTYTWSSLENTPDIVFSSGVALSATFTVSGTDLNGCVNTATVMQVVDLCTGFSKTEDADVLVNFFPNPSNGVLTANFNFDGRKNLFIFDETGRVVMSLSTEDKVQTIDMTAYAKGMYFVKLQSQRISKNFRIVTQ